MAITFDLTQIPSGSTINSASLQFYSYARQGPLNATAAVYRISRDWDPAVASWSKATASTNWSQQGGDMGTKVSSRTRNGDINAFESYDVLSGVSYYVKNPAGNFGFLFKMDNGTDGHGFYNSKWATMSQRPRLVVTYQPSTAVAPISCTVKGNRISAGQVAYRLDGSRLIAAKANSQPGACLVVSAGTGAARRTTSLVR